MAQEITPPRKRSNAYNIFIFVLIINSLVIMVAMFLPLNDAVIELLRVYDNLICLIFLLDFFISLRRTSNKSDYFIHKGGWLDLIGSIPLLGLGFKYTGLLRLARLSRLTRIARRLGREKRGDLIRDVVRNRSQYAAFITILLTLFILSTASVLVLQFESDAPGSNIQSGWDAFWYSVVTITTVGYGDHYPISTGGRITAMFIMVMGVGIIGALASILSSVLVGSSSTQEEVQTPSAAPAPMVEQELETIKIELAALRQLLEKMSIEGDKH